MSILERLDREIRELDHSIRERIGSSLYSVRDDTMRTLLEDAAHRIRVLESRQARPPGRRFDALSKRAFP